MAKFSDLPPEIAEEIVTWVELITSQRVNDEQEALLDLMAGPQPPEDDGGLGGGGPFPPLPLGGPGPRPPGAGGQQNRRHQGNGPGNGNPLNALFNMFAGAAGGAGGGNHVDHQHQHNGPINPQPGQIRFEGLGPPPAPQNHHLTQNRPAQRPPAAQNGQQQPQPRARQPANPNNPFAGMFAPPAEANSPPRPLGGAPFTFNLPVSTATTSNNTQGLVPAGSTAPLQTGILSMHADDDGPPPLEPIPRGPSSSRSSAAATAGSSSVGARRGPASSSGDDEMPALERLTPTNAQGTSKPAASSQASSSKKPLAKKTSTHMSDDDDDMPPLEPFDPKGKSKAKAPTQPKPQPVASSSKKGPVKPQPAHLSDDDGMPPLEPLNGSGQGKGKPPLQPSQPSTSKAPASQKQTPKKPTAAHISDDDVMPPLEPLNSQNKGKGKAAPSGSKPATGISSAGQKKPAVKPAHISDDDGMPSLEPLDPVKGDTQTSSAAPSKSASKNKKKNKHTGSKTAPAHVSDDDGMPPLEPLNGAGSATSTSTRPVASQQQQRKKPAPASDDDMPPLEPLQPTTSVSQPKKTATPLNKPAQSKGKADSDDDMPALEPLYPVSKPSTTTAKGEAKASSASSTVAPHAKAPAAFDSDGGEPPPLEPLQKPATSSSNASKSAASTSPKKNGGMGGGGGGFFANFGKQLKKGSNPFGTTKSPSKKPAESKASEPVTGAGKSPVKGGPSVDPDLLSDDDMPEPVPVSPPRSPKYPKRTLPKPQSSSEDDVMPALEPLSNSPATQQKKVNNTSRAARVRNADSESDDDMPALEPLDKPALKLNVQPPSRNASKSKLTNKQRWDQLSQVEKLQRMSRKSNPQSFSSDEEPDPAKDDAPADKRFDMPPPLEAMSSDSSDEYSSEEEVANQGDLPPPLEPMSSDSDMSGQEDYPDADEDDALPPPLQPVDNSTQRLTAAAAQSNPEDDTDHDWSTTDEDSEASEDDSTPRWIPSEVEWRVDPESWSYPDGLPSDPILPLMLVSRPFLHAARKVLYAKGVNINGPFPLHLFVRTLTSPQVSAFVQDNSYASKATINTIVKSLNLHIACSGGGASVGRGGIGLVAQAIESCPRVQTVNIRSDPLRSAWPVLEKALRQATELESLSMRSGSDETHPMVLSTDRLIHLAQSWPNLKSLDILGLMAPPRQNALNNAVITRALTNVSLISPTVTGPELNSLLNASVGTLTVLKVIDPSNAMTRGDLAEILVKHAPHIKELVITVSRDWHPRTSAAPPSASAEISQFFLNTVISKFKQLETLHFLGPLANSNIFALMPSSINKLSWGQCTAIEPRKVAALLSTPTKSGKQRLPKLSCLTVTEDDLHWSDSDFKAVQTQLHLRGACFHNSGPSIPLTGFDGGGGGLVPPGVLNLGPLFV